MSINIEIRSAEEHAAAMEIIQRLSGAPEDSPEETRLEMLIEAVTSWEAERDNSPA